jgi:hypothetical protein
MSLVVSPVAAVTQRKLNGVAAILAISFLLFPGQAWSTQPFHCDKLRLVSLVKTAKSRDFRKDSQQTYPKALPKLVCFHVIPEDSNNIGSDAWVVGVSIRRSTSRSCQDGSYCKATNDIVFTILHRLVSNRSKCGSIIVSIMRRPVFIRSLLSFQLAGIKINRSSLLSFQLAGFEINHLVKRRVHIWRRKDPSKEGR